MAHLADNAYYNIARNFDLLERSNRRLFAGDAIKVVDNLRFDHQIPVIGLDQFDITDSEEPLGTNGLSTGFVLCLSGKRADGKTLRALCRTTHRVAFKTVFEQLKQQMLLGGCKEESLAAYVIGGQRAQTLQQEIDVIEMARENPLFKQLKFNLTKEDQSLSVVFAPDGIFVSRGKLFSETESQEDTGDALYGKADLSSQTQMSSL